MADRTSQPADGVGINSLYSDAIFLWNGIAPTKNQIGGATATSKGTNTSGGADGTYQLFSNTDGAMSWSLTTPSSAYTLVMGIVLPAEVTYQQVLSIPSRLRVEVQRTGGGFYVKPVHSGVGELTAAVVGVGSVNSNNWTLVLRYNGTDAVRYLWNGDTDTAESNVTNTTAFGGAGTSIELGSSNNAATGGLYAVALMPSDVGATEAAALRDNIWRVFAPEGGGATKSHLVGGQMSNSLLLHGLRG